MRALFALTLTFALSACGGYLGVGPAPRLNAPRGVALDIRPGGPEQKRLEAAAAWLTATGDVRRVKAGGDAVVELHGRLARDRFVLAGTDAALTVTVTARRGDAPLVSDKRVFAVAGVTSNLDVEVEKLAAKGTAWALERVAAALDGPPPAEPATEAAPTFEPDDVSVPTPAGRPQRRKRR
jgi:hypothetical protein